MTEKGAMLNHKTEKVLNTDDKTERLNNSQPKNTRIEDFFGFSGKKRQREIDNLENKESNDRGIFLNNFTYNQKLFSYLENLSVEVIDLSNDTHSVIASHKNVENKKKSSHASIHKRKQKLNKSQINKNKQILVDSGSQDIPDNMEQKREKKNRNSCSICRNGGDLLLCDNCPKSFHLECLKLKASDIPEGSWYCTNCM